MANLAFAGPLPGVNQLDDTGSWENFFLPFRGDGVVPGGMVPSINSGSRQVSFTAGRAFLRAYVAQATATNTTSVPAASGQNRIDRLVLRLDRTALTDTTIIVPTVIQGTPGANPQPPALTQSTDHLWDLPICRWQTNASGTLTGLVDERTLLGGPVLAAGPGAQPFPPDAQRLLVTDKQVLASLGGSIWDTTLFSDSGWQSLTVNGPDRGAWTADGVCRVRAYNGIVQLRFTIMRAGSSALGATDANGSTPFTLDSPFRPSQSVPFTGYSGFFNGPRKPAGGLVSPDGSVAVYALGYPASGGGGDPINQPGASGAPDYDVEVGSVIGGAVTYLLG